MKDCPFCSGVCEWKDSAVQVMSSAAQKTGVWLAAAYAAAVAWLSSLVISEALLVKTCLVSLGILIGATFSDFFKKHRWLVALLGLTTLTLFVYRVISELDDEEEF